VITRAWKAGDKVDVVLPMKPQRVYASDKIEYTRKKVALRYGPLVYNIEQVDQYINKVLSPDSPLTTEWIVDLLGVVMVINGKLADDSPMMAIPNTHEPTAIRNCLEGALPWEPMVPCGRPSVRPRR
jgi:DUF1680 family protein